MIDNCGICAGGNTGLVPNADEDCNGDCFGTAMMDNCGVCAGGNTGLVPNADEDCEGTCFGTALPGTPCDDGNPNTINDTWDAGCNCVGIPTGCTEDLVLTINTDDMGSETTWEIYNKVGNVLSASGGPYADVPGGTTEIEQICLPAGCFDLFVYDSFGDGIVGGGYTLVDAQQRRIIDNTYNGGGFTTVSTLANNVGWCVPIASNKLIGGANCDNLNYAPSDFMVAQPVAAPAPRPAGASHDNARIAALESAVLALTNSVTLLNQQMTGLATELQKQTNAQNMITITPTATVDAAQDARLDGIDTLLQSLAQNVADYNNQMTTLISQYQSLHPKPRAAPKTAANNFGLKTA